MNKADILYAAALIERRERIRDAIARIKRSTDVDLIYLKLCFIAKTAERTPIKDHEIALRYYGKDIDQAVAELEAADQIAAGNLARLGVEVNEAD